MRTIIINWLLLAAFSGASSVTAATHEYLVTVADDLASLQVEVRFQSGVESVSARAPNADSYLLDAEDCDTGRPLRSDSRHLIIENGGIQCLSYSIDLAKAASADSRNIRLGTDAVIVSPTTWMWRPRLGGKDSIVVAFKLPDGIDVSVPWRPIAGKNHAFRLRSSPQSGTAIAIFGKFDTAVVRVASVDLRVVSVPSTTNPISKEVIERTRKTAEHLTLAYGRFPNPHARVVLFPTTSTRSESAVLYGRVVRDGGETIELMIDPRQSEQTFLGDWTATHEFAHLMLPYVDRDERWISEGFAQYYQNVLLARAGLYTQQFAWQKINDGLERGREAVPFLSPNEAADSDQRNTRMKIYWSGAALALIADVELRRRSAGTESLDLVLDRFQACCLPSRRTWSGMELFEKFDSLIDKPLFAELYRRHADTAGFPEIRPLLDRLGVGLAGPEVRLDDDSELAEIRAALTARRYTGEPGR